MKKLILVLALLAIACQSIFAMEADNQSNISLDSDDEHFFAHIDLAEEQALIFNTLKSMDPLELTDEERAELITMLQDKEVLQEIAGFWKQKKTAASVTSLELLCSYAIQEAIANGSLHATDLTHLPQDIKDQYFKNLNN